MDPNKNSRVQKIEINGKKGFVVVVGGGRPIMTALKKQIKDQNPHTTGYVKTKKWY